VRDQRGAEAAATIGHDRERPQEAAPQDRHRGGACRCPRASGRDRRDACAAAQESGGLGKWRIRTFALPDACELFTGDRIADAEEDGRNLFEEAGAEGGPDEREGEGKCRRVGHGQGRRR
jgi:hypothetical protein